MGEFQDYLALVARLNTNEINRSENDLSSNLKNALASFGLHGVVDTGSGANRAKRPDIALYADLAAADVGSAADVVVEAKKPREIASFPSLIDALVDDDLWGDKFVPYLRAHAQRVRYFILTTFERFLVVPVGAPLRAAIPREESFPDRASRTTALAGALSMDLRTANGGSAFAAWCATHLTADTLAPPPLSSIIDLKMLDDADALEDFASALADVVVGPEGRPTPGGALLASINIAAQRFEDLEPATRRGLVIYTMAAHGGVTVESAQAYLERHLETELTDFINASVHSLVGRLFAVKAIEDGFCINTDPPLIPRDEWVFHSKRFDHFALDALPAAFFAALGGLAAAENPALRDLAATGRFYDWLGPQVDPAAFRRLIELFFAHNFARLDGDLLGRFFEIYAQRVDRRRRKQLGQYYTPLPIVRHMWRLSLAIARERNVVGDLLVLDPAVGSGTFLIEGARRLKDTGISRFWERLTGFDISAQAIGIAQINVYLAVLVHLDREQAESVGTLGLYPTDALDPRNGAKLRSVMPLLTDDTTRAFLKRRIELSEKVKQRTHFPLVVGNPPYRNNSDLTLAQVAERFPRLLRSSRDNARARQRNIRDDYAWFFAAADYYVADRGLVAFVVSDSFCYAGSYRFFRQDLLRLYRVRHLLNLGVSIFRDVGPRTQFVIIVLERRDGELVRADDCEPIEYVDLRPLIAEPKTAISGGGDPRLAALDSGRTPPVQLYTPVRERDFALFPAADVVSRVNAVPIVLCGTNPRRVFIKKWPGLITAFDELFRARTRRELEDKIQMFLAAAALDGSPQTTALEDLALQIRATSPKNRGRLTLMAEQARALGLTFEPGRIRRVVTGTAPNDAGWYPDERQTAWVYYEPRLAVPRNVNVGRDPGWGTMSQWRDPESHEIGPKLVFTTSTNPEAGFKAFVLPGDWMVKLHGGESQQFSYTGIDNPLAEGRLGEPNNIGPQALTLYENLLSRGHNAEDFLHYIAGIYNSQVAAEYLEGGGGNVMHIPVDPSLIEPELADRVIETSRSLRNLHWLRTEATGGARVDAELAERLASTELLVSLDFEELPGSGGRFVQRRGWRAGPKAEQRLAAEIVRLRELLDDDVNELYPAA